MPLRSLECVLFDLDGTLVNTGPLILNSFAEAVDEVLGLNLSPAEFLPGVGIPLRTQLERVARAHLQGDIRMAFAGAVHGGRPASSLTAQPVLTVHDEGSGDSRDVTEVAGRLISAYRTVNERLHDSLIESFAGIEEQLEELRLAGIPMGIVTSKRDSAAWRDLSHFGLDRYFEVLVGADSVDKHKPDPYPLHVALEQLSEREGLELDAAVTAYIGDSPFDMLASKAAGTMTVAAVWGMFSEDTLLEHGPDLVLCEPKDLEQLRRPPFERTARSQEDACGG